MPSYSMNDFPGTKPVCSCYFYRCPIINKKLHYKPYNKMKNQKTELIGKYHPWRSTDVRLAGQIHWQFSLVQSLSDELQHARSPCPSPSPGVHSDSRPSSLWCHLAISSSVIPFSSCPQSLPASKSFPMSQLFAWGSQSTGASALESFLPEKSQGWCPSEWTGWISLQSKGLSRVFSNTTVQNINSSALSLLHSPTLTSIHDHWKNHSLD